SSRRRHTRSDRDWSSDVCSSDLTFSATVKVPAKLLEQTIASDRSMKSQRLTMARPRRLLRSQSTGGRGPPPEADAGRRDGLRNRSEERRVGKECRRRREA